jgi:hypothetical protein
MWEVETLKDYLKRVHGDNRAALGRELGVNRNNVKTILDGSIIVNGDLYRKAKNQFQREVSDGQSKS